MELFLTPNLTVRIVYLTGLTAALVYLIRLPEKSVQTRWILGFLAAWFLHLTILTLYEITHTHLLISGPGFENSSLATGAFLVTEQLFLLFLCLLTYRIGFRYSKWEESIVLAVIAITGGLVIYWHMFTDDVSVLVDRARIVTRSYLIANAWIVLAGIRKLWSTWRRGYDNRTRRLVVMIMLTAAATLTMVSATSYLAVIWPFSAELRGILPTLLAVSVAGFVVIGYLLYSGERHTLQVKLVGFLLIAYVSIFASLVPTMRTEVGLRAEFENPSDRVSLVFEPDSVGAYTVSGVAPDWIEPDGSSHFIADDASVAVRSAFPIPFYGATYDSVWVGSNGSISFGRELDADLTFSSGLSLFDDTPSANPMYADLIMAGRPADLRIDAAQGRLVATWSGVSLYDLHESTMTLQAVMYPDGVIRFNYLDISTLPLLRYVGITPGGSTTPSVLPTRPGETTTAGVGEAVFERVDVRDEYRRFVHPLMIPIVWIGVGGLLLVLIGGLLFYRIGLLNPLERVLTGLRSVEAGELTAEVEIPERNELGALADHFNRMAASIRQYNEHMEDLVEERTAELRSTQAQLVEQEKLASLGSLTAGIAHEIKNPLNFVNNFAEVSSELAGELREAVKSGDRETAQAIISDLLNNTDQIAKHGKRADSIVRSMMQHARGGPSEKETVDVNTFVDEYVDLAWHGMRAREHGFEVEIEKDFGEAVGEMTVQSQEIGRVLVNLLNNAFQVLASSQGPDKGLVRVATRRNGSAVQITISDNGPGIPPDIRSHIFEPFFTTKSTGEGTGLGLSLSYDIVTKGHGGSLDVRDADEGGAEFVVTLPAG